jgi:hypothetical protein
MRGVPPAAVCVHGASCIAIDLPGTGESDSRIDGSELVVFEHLSHGPLHEDPDTFNRATLDFLLTEHS